MALQVGERERQVFWRARLQPFSHALAFMWTALSFQQSHTAGLAVYAAAFTVLLGSTLMDGSLLHQLGVLLLLSALCYGLLAAGLRSRGLELGGTIATDGNAVLSVVCVHLARLDRLLLAGITEIIALRAQKPVWFYVSGMVVVFLIGRLGQWLSLPALLWIAVSVTLMLPAALSRGWVSIPTPQAVQGALCQAAASVQATVTQLTSPHPLPPPSSQP